MSIEQSDLATIVDTLDHIEQLARDIREEVEWVRRYVNRLGGSA